MDNGTVGIVDVHMYCVSRQKCLKSMCGQCQLAGCLVAITNVLGLLEGQHFLSSNILYTDELLIEFVRECRCATPI